MYALWFRKPVDIQDPEVIDPSAASLLEDKFGPDGHLQWEIAQPRARNIKLEDYEILGLRLRHFLGIYAAMGGLSAIYGAVHIAVWNSDFPTQVEKCLWKSCCLIVTPGCIVTASWLFFDPKDGLKDLCLEIIYTMKEYFLELYRERKSFSDTFINLVGSFILIFYLLVLLGIFLTPFFLCARMILTIESFISLRKAPAGVYAAVPWAASIPHF
jgi:hypothetical protein